MGRPLPLPIHSYALRSPPGSSARLLNCFASQAPPDAKTPVRLVRAPGIAQWTTVGTGPIWANFKALGYLWVLSGSKLYRVDTNKTATLIGDIGVVSSVQNIDIEANAQSIVVVNAPNAFYYDGTTFGQITDPDFTSRGAGDVEFIDDWLLFREPNSGRFFGADLGSPNSFDSLNFATAEGAPDNLVGLKVDHRQAILPGETTVELWEDVGGSGFPFQRSVNGFLEIGCLNGRTMVKCDNSVFWLANDYTVRRLDGISPSKISQEGIEQKLRIATVSQAVAWSYTVEGHVCYVLVVPEGTFVYDCTSKEWHERGSYGYDFWRAQTHAQFAGLELVGDPLSNQIGYLDPTVYSEWNTELIMQWTYQPIYASAQRAFHQRLEIIVQTGVGTATGQGVDPQLMLECSDDGGISWEPVENLSLGAQGATQTPVVSNQLGSAYQRVYRASVSDPVAVTVTDTQIEVSGARPFRMSA